MTRSALVVWASLLTGCGPTAWQRQQSEKLAQEETQRRLREEERTAQEEQRLRVSRELAAEAEREIQRVEHTNPYAACVLRAKREYTRCTDAVLLGRISGIVTGPSSTICRDNFSVSSETCAATYRDRSTQLAEDAP